MQLDESHFGKLSRISLQVTAKMHVFYSRFASAVRKIIIWEFIIILKIYRKIKIVKIYLNWIKIIGKVILNKNKFELFTYKN